MNNKFKSAFFIIMIVILLIINFVVNYNSLEKNNIKSNKAKSSIIEDIKSLKKASDFLNSKKPFAIDSIQKISSPSGNTASPGKTLQTLKFKMKILNASEVQGIASKIRDNLSKLGFLEEITLGNTESTTSSYLKIKSTIPADFKEQIFSTVVADSPKIIEQELFQDESSDIILIIGSER